MHQALEDAGAALELELENLRRAASLTAEKRTEAVDAAREYLRQVGMAGQHNLDIVAFGSIARDEMAPGSDFDWLIVARRFSEDPDDFVHMKKAAREARSAIAADDHGSSGLFGTVVGSTELVNSIGLEGDTNLTHTRRILILEESISLLEHDRHRELRAAITARYLHDQAARRGTVPRFLLNDVVRYWRTVAVDYQAKRWQEVEGEKWGLRLLKLRSTRKLTFAGTLVSLLLPALRGERPNAETLAEQWQMPPLARLAQLHELVGDEGRTQLRLVLDLADRFAGWLHRDGLREEAKGVAHLREAPEGTEVADAYRATGELNEALMSLFFSNEDIGEVRGGLQRMAHHYLIF